MVIAPVSVAESEWPGRTAQSVTLLMVCTHDAAYEQIEPVMERDRINIIEVLVY